MSQTKQDQKNPSTRTLTITLGKDKKGDFIHTIAKDQEGNILNLEECLIMLASSLGSLCAEYYNEYKPKPEEIQEIIQKFGITLGTFLETNKIPYNKPNTSKIIRLN